MRENKSNKRSGRKQDPVWLKFERIVTAGKSDSRAKCKQCEKEIQGLVARMNAYINQCQPADEMIEVEHPDSEQTTTVNN